jgi:methyl coenzyme M reductase subunit C-like uncharacterized protein (methanogenesis marker protein 7)
MEAIKQVRKNKAGRPKKAIKQNHFIGVKCSLVEKTILRQKAKAAGLKLSEFLRESGLNGQAVGKIKALPKEVLQFAGTLNHLAANLNQVAKKRNRMDELNALERADLQMLSRQVKQLAVDIKNYLR